MYPLSAQEDRQSPDKKLFVSAGSTKAIPLHKKRIFAAGASSPDTTLTFPNLSEAEGHRFTVTATTVPATTGSQVLLDLSNGNESASFSTTIATTGVAVTVESNGREWLINRPTAS